MNRKSSRIPSTISRNVSILVKSELGRRVLTIDITETTSFALLCVMETTSPVDSDVALLSIQSGGTFHTTTSADTAKLEQAVEHGTIVTDVVFALLAHVTVHVVGGDFL